MERILPVCAAAIVWLSLSAFTVIGRITDAGGEEVGYASVTARMLPSDSIAYLLSDGDGVFKAQCAVGTDSVELTVKSLGMMPHRQIYKPGGDTLRITIREDARLLGEVVVKGSPYGVVERGDTLVFDPKRFRNATDHSIGDVINKMPGMTVDENGSVSFQGQKVDKILVDGKDLFSSPEAFINTLPADFAAQIELTGSYSDGAPSDAFRTDPRTALNLKRPKGASTTSMELSGAGGIFSKYQSENTLMHLSPGHSLGVVANTNNTGKPLFSVMDWLRSAGELQGVINSGEATLSLGEQERQMLFPPDNEESRDAQLANVTYSHEDGERYKMSAGAIFHHTFGRGAAMTEQDYFGAGYRNFQRGSTERRNIFGTMNMTHTWQEAQRWSVRAKTTLSSGKSTDRDILSNMFMGEHMLCDDNARNVSLSLAQSLTFEKRYGAGLLAAEANGTFGYSDMDASGTGFDNTRRILSGRVDGSIGWLHSPPRWNGNCLKAALQGRYAHREDEVRGFDRNSVSVATPGLYLGALKNRGLLRYEVGVGMGCPILAVHGIQSPLYPRFMVSPQIMGELYFSQQHRLKAKASFSREINDMERFSTTPWQQGSLEKVAPTGMRRLYQGICDASISYRYMRLFDRLTLFGFCSYKSKRDMGLGDVSTDGLVRTVKWVDGGWQNILFAQMMANKGVGRSPVDCKLNLRYNRASMEVSSCSVRGELVTDEPSVSGGVATRFQDKPCNLDINLYGSWKRQRIDASGIDRRSVQWGASVKASFRKGDWNVYLTAKYDCVDDDGSKLRFPDMDAEASYAFGRRKEWKIGIRGENLLHLRKYEWSTSLVTPVMSSTERYRRLPGFLIGTLSWALR